MNIIESVDLHCTEGSSDKLYLMRIEESGGLYTVCADYGRRGSTLQSTDITRNPVSLGDAQKAYRKQLSSKLGKGYVVMNQQGGASAPSSSPSAPAPKAHANKSLQPTGRRPQLCNKIEETTARQLVGSEEWAAQEKFNGHRWMVKVEGGGVLANNRRGTGILVPAELVEELKLIPGSAAGVLFDGEYVDGKLVIFDVLEDKGQSLEWMPMMMRDEVLQRISTEYLGYRVTNQVQTPSLIKFAVTAFSRLEKERLLADVRARNGEGLVFKRVSSLYKAGRPASGGDALKFKLYETADVIVRPTNRRSVEAFVYHAGQLRSVGVIGSGLTDKFYEEVARRHAAGETLVLEVRYLYLTERIERGGQLFQSAIDRKEFRTDKLPEECLSDQLKVDGNVLAASPKPSPRAAALSV